jgi:hypothetical protein
MRLTQQQIQHLANSVVQKWKKNNVVTFKEDEKKVLARAVQALLDECQKEAELDREVNRMLDQLERTNSGEFQRFKMFPMLKQKLAKEKKVIL